MRRGFTLIELSIVLVIISLVIGGVLVGRDLITAANNRKVISEVDAIKTGITTFRLKYNCLPGDCASATNFFGTDGAGCPSVLKTTTVAGTCNGDNDGMTGAIAGTVGIHEPFRAMQQLGLAGLIPATSLTGTPYSASYQTQVGVNVPASTAYSSAGYLLLHQQNAGIGAYGTASGGGIYFWEGMPRGHVIYFGQSGAQYGSAGERFMKGIDALAIDSKMDDGLPQSGKVVTRLSDTYCHNPVNAATAQYVIDSTGACLNLFFGVD